MLALSLGELFLASRFPNSFDFSRLALEEAIEWMDSLEMDFLSLNMVDV